MEKRVPKRFRTEADHFRKIWLSMKARCLNASAPNFHLYGARGISISTEWLVFENFKRDMWPRPSKHHSIDRIDNSQGYSKENCRWADSLTQHRNKRTNILITINGDTLCQKDWAKRIGIHASSLAARIKMGWTDDDLLSSPNSDLRRTKHL